jgi:hypothetical protein
MGWVLNTRTASLEDEETSRRYCILNKLDQVTYLKNTDKDLKVKMDKTINVLKISMF